jgi:hypothetical protein
MTSKTHETFKTNAFAVACILGVLAITACTTTTTRELADEDCKAGTTDCSNESASTGTSKSPTADKVGETNMPPSAPITPPATGGNAPRGNPPANATCSSEATLQSCFDCCGSSFPAGKAAWSAAFQRCICDVGTPDGCVFECNSNNRTKSFCSAGGTFSNDDKCGQCIATNQAARDCEKQADRETQNDPNAAAWVACVGTTCNGKP